MHFFMTVPLRSAKLTGGLSTSGDHKTSLMVSSLAYGE